MGVLERGGSKTSDKAATREKGIQGKTCQNLILRSYPNTNKVLMIKCGCNSDLLKYNKYVHAIPSETNVFLHVI